MLNRKRSLVLETSIGIALALVASTGCAGKKGHAPKETKVDADQPSLLTGGKSEQPTALKLDDRLIGKWTSGCEESTIRTVEIRSDASVTSMEYAYPDSKCSGEAVTKVIKSKVAALEQKDGMSLLVFTREVEADLEDGELVQSTVEAAIGSDDSLTFTKVAAIEKHGEATRQLDENEVKNLPVERYKRSPQVKKTSWN
jgi:hypothetical protein